VASRPDLDGATIEELTLSAIELTTALEQNAQSPVHAALPNMAASAAGQVGRYELLLEIASGGMATVYVGRQRGAGGFQRLVAIKRMHPHIGSVTELAAAFMDEARIASLIRHPNVVNVHDVHDADGEHLLVMDYVDGASLANVMRAARRRNERLSRPAVIRILIDALRGLHAAHELTTFEGVPLGVVHRDATPHNILLGTDGAVKITDFGIAKAAERSVHTATGLAKGKFRYMAPEQARGGAIDRRVDVFAMGIVAWELFMGERLFQAEADAQVLLEITEGNFRRPISLDKTFPQELDRIVMKALAMSANDRHPTADSFADALEAWAKLNSELVSNAEIARLVHEFCGAPIVERRRAVAAVLAGTRQPPNFQGARQSQGSGTGSNATSAPLTLDSVKVVAALQPEVMKRQRLFRRLSLVAAGLALLVVIGAGAVIYQGMSRKESATAVEPPPALPAVSLEAPLPSTHVRVVVNADVDIAEIRGIGVKDIRFMKNGATLSVPRSDQVASLWIRLADGSELTESVIPSESVALRVRSVAQKPGTTPKTTVTRPGAAVGKPNPGLEANPYE
jgi:eukaryotic-like serine/threonine-protein kinase